MAKKQTFISKLGKEKKNFKFVFQNQDDMNIFISKNISSKSNSLVISGSGINTKEFPFVEREEKKEKRYFFKWGEYSRWFAKKQVRLK